MSCDIKENIDFVKEISKPSKPVNLATKPDLKGMCDSSRRGDGNFSMSAMGIIPRKLEMKCDSGRYSVDLFLSMPTISTVQCRPDHNNTFKKSLLLMTIKKLCIYYNFIILIYPCLSKFFFFFFFVLKSDISDFILSLISNIIQ